jgi:hypothetical protein
MRASFQSYYPQNPDVIKHHCRHHLLLIQPVYQYTSYVECVTNTYVLRVFKKCLNSRTRYQ